MFLCPLRFGTIYEDGGTPLCVVQFIRELFKPQEMYSSSSTREIFNKLAHSSIMRLNESSMDKLYDLMTMGFKHQVGRASCVRRCWS